jgi:hypothetical protein
MCHFLSPDVAKARSGASRSISYLGSNHPCSMLSAKIGALRTSGLCLMLLAVCVVLTPSSLFAQQPFTTSRGDNARDAANTSETLLTPANVNKTGFGHLFSVPIDPGTTPASAILAQPLYMPNVNIPGQGVHNVVYVASMADSVYAIDADTGTQLWYASMLDGGTTASGADLPCGYGGFKQEGILGTPAIDTNTNTMYLVAKTLRNGVVRHDIHALDITTGNDLPGSPVLIVAQSISNKSNVMNFNSLHQKNRPGMLLSNGVLYMGFGSNGCNDSNSGWVLSYDEASLAPLGVFNTSPDWGLTSIWQSGSGLSADENGYVYASTAEAGSHGYDVPSGGQTYCHSILKLAPSTLTLTDYFTPSDVLFYNQHDLDVSSAGTVVLPDQDGPYPRQIVATGKQGMIYVLNRDQMGTYYQLANLSAQPDPQIIQEVSILPNAPAPPGSTVSRMFGTPAYWNNALYFAPDAAPITAFPVSGGVVPLGAPVTTPGGYAGSHSPSISANGNSNGVLWAINGTQLSAFNACISQNPCQGFAPLQLLYTTNQAAGGRDKLPAVAHFATQTVANGKVYVATQTTLEAYGLFHTPVVTAGNGQTGPAGTALPVPFTVNVPNPYTGQPDVGAQVMLSDGGKGGSFNPPSPVYTDANGNATSTYTLPKKVGTYTLTFSEIISGKTFASTTATATAIGSVPAKLLAFGGSKQTGAEGFALANPVIAQVQDANKNPVAGAIVTFTSNKTGTVFNPSSVATDVNGKASTSVQMPPTPGTVTITATGPAGVTPAHVTFTETSVAPVATNISITSGNNQSAPAGTQLNQALTVLVIDQFGHPLVGNSVTFTDNGAGGTFSYGNTVVTGLNGTASELYTLPTTVSSITINATATGLSGPAVFTENSVVGPAANIAVGSGNNQFAPAGTLLPLGLTVFVTDQGGNPVSGIAVTFSDGGAGGIFSNSNPVTTGTNGTATQFYTLPSVPGLVSVTATAVGVANGAVLSETAQ